MSPLFYTILASLLFAYRWWLIAVVVLGIVASVAAIALGPRDIAFAASVLAGPLIAIPYALFCACIWFHPERGNLRSGSKSSGKLPAQVQSALRWCASLFLFSFLVAGAVVWPLLAWNWP